VNLLKQNLATGSLTADEVGWETLNQPGRVHFRGCAEKIETTPEPQRLYSEGRRDTPQVQRPRYDRHPERTSQRLAGSADGKLISDSVARAVE